MDILCERCRALVYIETEGLCYIDHENTPQERIVAWHLPCLKQTLEEMLLQDIRPN